MQVKKFTLLDKEMSKNDPGTHLTIVPEPYDAGTIGSESFHK